MTPDEAADAGRPPCPPHPGGVVDLARYRGRSATVPAAVPPPPVAGDGAALRSPLRAVTDAEVDRPEGAVPPVPPPAIARPAGPVLDLTDGPEERVIHRLRLGSVARMAFGLSLCAVAVVIGAGALVWVVLSGAGVVDNLESLAEDLGWVDVRFNGPAMLRPALIIGAVVVVATTLLSVVAAEVFNLLSTITGGLRAEVGPPPPTRRQRRRARKQAQAGDE